MANTPSGTATFDKTFAIVIYKIVHEFNLDEKLYLAYFNQQFLNLFNAILTLVV